MVTDPPDVEKCCGCDTPHDHEEYMCRICFDDVLKPSEVISPCKCMGTLKYVHPGCLYKWQRAVIKLSGAHDERAYVCSVCRTPYSTAPPRPNPWGRLRHAARSIAGATAISLLALCLTCGPSLLHIALLVIVLFGVRSQSIPALAALVATCVVATLYLRGLRVVLHMDPGAPRYGLALMRTGPEVPGLAPGTLLVASRQLDGTLFAQSVVLLYEGPGAQGARGVMLTQPIEAGGPLLAQHPLAHRLTALASIRHFMGGPVGLGFQGSPDTEVVVLHSEAHLPGARQVVACEPAAGAAGAAAAAFVEDVAGGDDGGGAAEGGDKEEAEGEAEAAAVADAAAAVRPAVPRWRQRLLRQQQQPHRQPPTQPDGGGGGGGGGADDTADGGGGGGAPPLALYHGGSLEQLIMLLQPLHATGAAAATAATAASASAAPPQPRARLFHGICAWAPGQLEGELRVGAWGMVAASPADVMSTPPQRLWGALVASPRLRWL